MRYFFYTLGDESVPVAPPTPELMEEMGRFVEEAVKNGTLVATGGMGPTAMGAKVRRHGDEYTVTDGPFAEAKELIGGWALMDLPDHAAAVEIAKRFLAVAGDGESRFRPVFGPEEGEPGFDL